MNKIYHIAIVVLLGTFVCFSQVSERIGELQIKGSVKGQENSTPISGVEVSTDSGEYALTDVFGEFKITAAMGDELTFESPQFETVRHIIRSSEDVDVRVKDYSENDKAIFGRNKSVGSEISSHALFLDSANFYKKTDIEKSIDFITKSIARLGNRGSKRELAQSLTTLGEVYHYHKQYDLAITSYIDALGPELHKNNFSIGQGLCVQWGF